MNVPSYQFLGFAALVAIVVNLSGAPAWRRPVLMIANVAFILTFTRDLKELAPFAALLALGFAGMKLMERYKSKAVFVVLLVAVVVSFCWLKRYAFLPHASFLPFTYFAVGMSYVFFRIVHLLVDAYQDALPDRVNALSYFNYTMNFTCLVSGPIQLYRDYRRTESERPLPLTDAVIGEGLIRIVVGFFKVSIVSPVLFAAHDRVVAAFAANLSPAARVADAVLIVTIFLIALYYNFSGYTDFVIGIGRFLRLDLPENFKKPYASQSFIDFWGRWHITLGNWVKTYIYSPIVLGLMRRFPSRAIEPLFGVFAYFVAFFFVGVWHGQTTMFIFLGVLLGLGVSVNKLYQIVMTRRLGRAAYTALCAQPFYAALSRGLTLGYFAFASLWFWSTWGQLGHFVSVLGPFGTTVSLLLLFAVATVVCWLLVTLDTWLGSLRVRDTQIISWPPLRTAWYTAAAVITISVTVALNAPAPHIVYKAF